MPPLPGYRPQCDAGRITGERHDIDGPHHDLCNEHHADNTRWRKARNIYVARQEQAASAAGQPFDRAAALKAREEAKPWRPDRLSDRARGVLPLSPPEVRLLRRTVDDLVDALLPVSTAYREGQGEDVTTKQMNLLLTTAQKHATYLKSLLKDVRR